MPPKKGEEVKKNPGPKYAAEEQLIRAKHQLGPDVVPSLESLLTAQVSFPALSSLLAALLRADSAKDNAIENLTQRVDSLQGTVKQLRKEAEGARDEAVRMAEQVRMTVARQGERVGALEDSLGSVREEIGKVDYKVAEVNGRVDQARDAMRTDREEVRGVIAKLEEERKEQGHINRRTHFTVEKANRSVDEARKDMEALNKAQRDLRTDLLIVEGKLAELGNPRFRVDVPDSIHHASHGGAASSASAAAAASPSQGGPLVEDLPEGEPTTDRGLFSLDRFAQVEQWTASASKRVMAAPADTLGRSFVDDMVSESHRAEVREAVDRALHTGSREGPITVPVRAPSRPSTAPAAPEVPMTITLHPRRDKSRQGGGGGGLTGTSPPNNNGNLDHGDIVGITVTGQAFDALVHADADLFPDENASDNGDADADGYGELLAVDRSLKVVRWSRTLSLLTGLEPATAWSTPLPELVANPATRAEVSKVLELGLAGRTGLSAVVPLAVDGGERSVKVRVAVHREVTQRGAVTGLSLVGKLSAEGVTNEALERAERVAKHAREAHDRRQAEALTASMQQQMQGQQQQGGGGGNANANTNGAGAAAAAHGPPNPSADSKLLPAPPGHRKGVLLAVDRTGRVQLWSDTAQYLLGGLPDTGAVGIPLLGGLVPEAHPSYQTVRTALARGVRGHATYAQPVTLSAGPNTWSPSVDFLPRADEDGAIVGVTLDGDLLPSEVTAGIRNPPNPNGDSLGETQLGEAQSQLQRGYDEERARVEGMYSSSSSARGRRRKKRSGIAGQVKDATGRITTRSDASGSSTGTEDNNNNSNNNVNNSTTDQGGSIDRQPPGSEQQDKQQQPPFRFVHATSSSHLFADARTAKALSSTADSLAKAGQRIERCEQRLDGLEGVIGKLSDLTVRKADAASVSDALDAHRRSLESLIREQVAEAAGGKGAAEAQIGRATEELARLSREIRNKASRSEVVKLRESLRETSEQLVATAMFPGDAAGMSRPLQEHRCLSCNRPLPHTHDDHHGHGHHNDPLLPAVHHTPPPNSSSALHDTLSGTLSSSKRRQGSPRRIPGALPDRGVSNAPRIHLERDLQGRRNEISRGGQHSSQGHRTQQPRYDALSGTIATSGGHHAPSPPRTAPAGVGRSGRGSSAHHSPSAHHSASRRHGSHGKSGIKGIVGKGAPDPMGPSSYRGDDLKRTPRFITEMDSTVSVPSITPRGGEKEPETDQGPIQEQPKEAPKETPKKTTEGGGDKGAAKDKTKTATEEKPAGEIIAEAEAATATK